MRCTAALLLASMTALAAGGIEEIPLWPNGASGSEGKTAPEVITETNGVRRVSSIHNPSITAHLPSSDKRRGRP